MVAAASLPEYAGPAGDAHVSGMRPGGPARCSGPRLASGGGLARKCEAGSLARVRLGGSRRRLRRSYLGCLPGGLLRPGSSGTLEAARHGHDLVGFALSDQARLQSLDQQLLPRRLVGFEEQIDQVRMWDDRRLSAEHDFFPPGRKPPMS